MANIEPDDQTPVWADVWNPDGNVYDPNATDLETWDEQTPGHDDTPQGRPMSEQYGDHGGAGDGSGPDARANLLTDVKRAGAQPPPTQVIRHEVQTVESGSPTIRSRTIGVTGNVTPARLLEENPNRKRAIIKVITTGAVVLIGPPFGGMGAPQLTGAPVQPVAAWAQATGDPLLTMNTTAAVDVLGCQAAGAVTLVTVWEELSNTPGTDDAPGLGT